MPISNLLILFSFFLNFMTIFALVFFFLFYLLLRILSTKVHISRPNWVVNDNTCLEEKKKKKISLRSQGKVRQRKARWPSDFLMTKPQLKLFGEMVVTAHSFCNLDSRHGQVGPYCVCVCFLTHHAINCFAHSLRADKNEIMRLELD